MNTPTVLRRHVEDTASGALLTYAEYLPAQRSETDIVFVHGLASAGLQFHQDALHFASRGHRVIVPDLRGHGASGMPSGPIRTADYTISRMAQDVIAMLDHAGAGRVHWVGNSLGGILALHLLESRSAIGCRALCYLEPASLWTCRRWSSMRSD